MEIKEIKDLLKSLSKGQSICLETEKQELLGILQHVDINLNFIFLDIVKDMKSNIKYTSRQMIPAEMIKYIKVVNNTEDTASTVSDCSSLETTNKFPPKENNDSFPTASLSTYEVKSLQSRISNPVVINQNGPHYVKALTDMRDQQFIALFVEPTKYGRNFKTSIITVATVQTVYVFDLISLGKLSNDFKNILESEIPRKVIHNSHLVADHFKFQHSIHINGIFDTFAAYCIVTKEKRHIDFNDIIEQFFNIDKQFFTSVIDDIDYPHNTFRRPMERSLIRECAKHACLILKLQEHLLHKMLSTFYSQCKEFSRTFMRSEDFAVVTNIMQTNTSAGFETITELDLRDQTI